MAEEREEWPEVKALTRAPGCADTEEGACGEEESKSLWHRLRGQLQQGRNVSGASQVTLGKETILRAQGEE